MAIPKLMKSEKILSWSFLGVIITLSIFGYLEFIKDKNPSLSYEILMNTSVLDVKEDVEDLKILFNEQDIREQNKTLTVVAVRIRNTSSNNIHESHFSEKSPLGLTISKGEMIKAELIDGSNDYLKDEEIVKIIQKNEQEIQFPNLIINGGDFFTIKILILHKENEKPELGYKGAILGVRTIALVSKITQEETIQKPSFKPLVFVILMFFVLFNVALWIPHNIRIIKRYYILYMLIAHDIIVLIYFIVFLFLIYT